MHPLIESLDELTDATIEKKITELNQKYWSTSNPELRMQIQMVLEVYTNTLQERRTKLWKKQQEEMDLDLESLIKID